MTSLGTPRKQERGKTGGSTCHPATPPDRQELCNSAIRSRAIAILAAAGELSPPPKHTKMQGGWERALYADELDAEWKGVRDDLISKLRTAGAAIEAL